MSGPTPPDSDVELDEFELDEDAADDDATTVAEMTVGQAAAMLVGNGAGERQALTVLHKAAVPNTLICNVPNEVWIGLIEAGGPLVVGALVRVNKYFWRLAREHGLPEGYESSKTNTFGYPQFVHVHTHAQLEVAQKLDPEVTKWIVVHPDIKIGSNELGAMACDGKPGLILGNGLTASNITGGQILLYKQQIGASATKIKGATATNIRGGVVLVYRGCTATNISSGQVDVFRGGTATDITDGILRVYRGGKATNIRGGKTYLFEALSSTLASDEASDLEKGGAANYIIDGDVYVRPKCTAADVAGGRIHLYPGGIVQDHYDGEIFDVDPDTGQSTSRDCSVM